MGVGRGGGGRGEGGGECRNEAGGAATHLGRGELPPLISCELVLNPESGWQLEISTLGTLMHGGE